MNKIDAIKLSIESENFAQRRTGRKGSSYYNGLAAGYREGYLNGFAEAGRQFLKTSQTKENQQSDEQLLLKHDVSGQSELFTCECSSEMERWNCTKDCKNKPKIVRS